MIQLLLAGGTALSILGQYGANQAQATQEKENERFYNEQAEFARLSENRAKAIASIDYTNKIGTQVSAYAASNVDSGSGSALLTIGATAAQFIDEIFAIKKKGELDYKLASMRGQFAGERAATLSSAGYNLVQGATTMTKAMSVMGDG